MKKQTAIFFYVLSIYVVLQFAWWGYHLIELTEEISSVKGTVSKRVFMIIGEGLVFFLILLIGLWKIRSSIKKELKLQANQNNFLLSVTHELKTPIAANKLYLQTIQKREMDAEKRNELLEKAVQENIRLEKMIDNILNATRLENKKMQIHKVETDGNYLIAGIAQRFNKIAGKNIIAIEGSFSRPVLMDSFIIETILNNLIENALKYAGTELPIIIEIEGEESSIIVKDHGPGIAVAEQAEVFKKFYRSGNEETRTQKGSGLGLFIASEFARIHGGKLSYHLNQPKGSVFELKL